MRRGACVLALAAAAGLAGCLGGDPPREDVTIALPAAGLERPALEKALEKAGVEATIVAGDGPDALVRRDDGSGAGSVGWDEELAGKLQAQGLTDCLGELRGQRVARFGTPSPQQRLGHAFVLEPLFDQDVVRRVDDLREADGVLAADDRAAAAALADTGAGTAVVGRGATVTGIRNIVANRQCLTLFESPEILADGVTTLAAALAAGEPAPGRPRHMAPAIVTRDSVADHVGDPEFPSRDDICAGALTAACEELDL